MGTMKLTEKRKTYDLSLAKRIVSLLNELIELDEEAVAKLFTHRVECNEQFADHPTVQVGQDSKVSLLGVLNGLCGITPEGRGPIALICHTREPLAPVRFEVIE